MQRLYEVENLNLREIADKFGVTFQAIHDRFVRAGVRLRRNGAVRQLLDRQTLVQLYIEEGLTISQTAQRLKTNHQKVSDELERHGIEKRSGGYFQRKQPELY